VKPETHKQPASGQLQKL